MWQGLLGVKFRGRDLVENGGSRIWRGPIEVVKREGDEMIIFERQWTAVSKDDGKSWCLCDSVPTAVSARVAGIRVEGDDAVIVVPGIDLKIMRLGNNIAKPTR